MRFIDEMHLKQPFYGSRRIRNWLVAENHDINRKRVQRAVNEADGYNGVVSKERMQSPGQRT
jgi:putative transposase